MATITLRFVTQKDLVSTLIRQMTDCAYSHVEFILDDGWAPALLAHGALGLLPGPLNGWTLGAHLDGGVKFRSLYYANFSAKEVVTVECTDAQKAAVVNSAVAAVGAPYDCQDIAGIVFHQNWTEKGHYICSVFVAKALLDAGINVLRVQPTIVPSITPRDLFLSPLLKSA